MNPAGTNVTPRAMLSTCCFLLIACVTAGLGAGEKEVAQRRHRTWTDSTGTYQVQASYVDFEDGRVLLEKPDGTEITVPFARLSSSDQNHVRHELRRSALAQRRQASTAARSADVVDVDKPVGEKGGAEPDRPLPAEPEILYGIHWHGSPADALAVGAEQDKPVMWFRVLGDLKGFM